MDSLHVLRSFLLLFIVFNHLPRTTTSMSEPKVITIDVNQAQKLLDSGYTFLDVRLILKPFRFSHAFIVVRYYCLVISEILRAVKHRTVEEFKKGHVDSENVFNVPYWLYTPQGQEINPNFLKHVSSLCNQTDHLILVIT